MLIRRREQVVDGAAVERLAVDADDAVADLRIGSPYFLKADLDGLRAADPCFAALSRAVLRLPPHPSVQHAADAILRRMGTATSTF